MCEGLIEYTQRIYDDPKNPARWSVRGIQFARLGFADLAAADVYKAIQLLAASLHSFMRDSNSFYEDSLGIVARVSVPMLQHKPENLSSAPPHGS